MTAEEILNRHLIYGDSTYLSGQEKNILAAMREIAERTFKTTHLPHMVTDCDCSTCSMRREQFEAFMDMLFPEKL